jgi:putative transposase
LITATIITNKKGYAMSQTTSPIPLPQEPKFEDPLTDLLRRGARQLILQAVEEELESFLAQHSSKTVDDGRRAVVRNGYLPKRTIQTGIGDVAIQVPKVRDRSCSGIKFNSSLLPPYLKKTRSIEELLPWLYLKGISTGQYQEALEALLGEQAKGLSANTISRLKKRWLEEHSSWRRRSLAKKRYVYWWADGVYSKVRLDDKLCLLVIIGVTDQGHKELVAVEDGYRESADSWYELLADLRNRGLTVGPELCVGDGALGFWNALNRLYPSSKHQRCWVHKTANVLNNLPKSMQPKVKVALHDIWMAETKEDANTAFDGALARFEIKYPKAMECLSKDRDELLSFYDFPAEHWVHIRTTNPIESTFSTVRLRTKKSRNCGSRETTLAMVFKLLENAQKRWKRIKGFRRLAEVITGVEFRDGVRVTDQPDRKAA